MKRANKRRLLIAGRCLYRMALGLMIAIETVPAILYLALGSATIRLLRYIEDHNLRRRLWYHLTRWITYHYTLRKGWWIKRITSDTKWFRENSGAYCDRRQVTDIITREAAETMRTQYAGCVLRVRISYSSMTRGVRYVEFRTERDGKPVPWCRLSNREMSRIEHQIRRLPIDHPMTTVGDVCTCGELRITFDNDKNLQS